MQLRELSPPRFEASRCRRPQHLGGVERHRPLTRARRSARASASRCATTTTTSPARSSSSSSWASTGASRRAGCTCLSGGRYGSRRSHYYRPRSTLPSLHTASICLHRSLLLHGTSQSVNRFRPVAPTMHPPPLPDRLQQQRHRLRRPRHCADHGVLPAPGDEPVRAHEAVHRGNPPGRPRQRQDVADCAPPLLQPGEWRRGVAPALLRASRRPLLRHHSLRPEGLCALQAALRCAAAEQRLGWSVLAVGPTTCCHPIRRWARTRAGGSGRTRPGSRTTSCRTSSRRGLPVPALAPLAC